LTELRERPPAAVAPAAPPETRQLARLADVGRLTAAMTQELEPLLTGLDGDVRGVLDADSIDAALVHAKAMSFRVSESQMLVQQLAGFSRKQQEPTSAQDLATIAGALAPALKPLMGPHVALRLDVTDGVTVDATRADVEQMLTTLLIAGRDLLPVGGSLVLRTGASEEGAAVLTVTAQGYGVVTDANTSALAAVVRQCNGTLTTGPAARAFEFKISF
jgi:signal transduction histidine kinase